MPWQILSAILFLGLLLVAFRKTPALPPPPKSTPMPALRLSCISVCFVVTPSESL